VLDHLDWLTDDFAMPAHEEFQPAATSRRNWSSTPAEPERFASRSEFVMAV